MALVLADVGADCWLKARLNNVWPANKDLIMKLFVNNVNPILDTSTAGTFTVAVGGAYVDKTLTCGSWTVTPANDPSDAVYGIQTWTFNGPLTTNLIIYGYYIVDGDGILQWAELLDAPFQPAASGDQLNITPKIQMSKGTAI